MSTISHLRKRAMNSARRILFTSRNSPFFGSPPPKSHHTIASANNSLKPGFNFNHSSNHYPFRILGLHRVLCCSNFALSRDFSFSLSTSNTDVSNIPGGFFKFQNFSTSIESRVNDSNFERIYIQGSVNVKPPLVVVEENVVTVAETRQEDDSEVEKRAWKLLEDAVVTYCGNPVGTVAANDPNDKQPLNYDQVFIRDFIPSALAFLLKGDSEIVKNFLLHTLQLQDYGGSFCCGLMESSLVTIACKKGWMFKQA